MEHNMNKEKRVVSILIPYRLKNKNLSVYLQKRSGDMERLPGFFGFWGGGIEVGETPEEGLHREIQEELEIDLKSGSATLFNKYEFLGSIKHVYLLEALEGWESKVVVHEGEYGKWFDLDEALKLDKLIFEDKVVLNDLERKLLNKPIK